MMCKGVIAVWWCQLVGAWEYPRVMSVWNGVESDRKEIAARHCDVWMVMLF